MPEKGERNRVDFKAILIILGNLTIVSSETNHKISNKKPYEYLNNLLEELESRMRNKRKAKAIFEELLRSHFINPRRSYWKSPIKFIEARRNEMSKFFTDKIIMELKNYIE